MNKDIKKGDRIWIYTEHLSKDSYYPVVSVKKKGTMVEVIVEASYFNDKKYEITMYGHASSSLLSGFDRKFGYREVCYTCDYVLIENKTKQYDRDQRYINAGKALLNVAKFLK